MPMSEIATIRKELHKMHFKLDDERNARQCAEAKVKTLELDLADAHAGKAQAERKIDILQAQAERKNAMLQAEIDEVRRENLLLKSQNDIADKSADKSDVGQILLLHKKIKELEEKHAQTTAELEKLQKAHNRVSNANTPPSFGSDAQKQLSKYRKENAHNYQYDKEDDRQKRKRRTNNRFGGFWNCVLHNGKQGPRKQVRGKQKKNNPAIRVPDMPVTKNMDNTVTKCPACDNENISVKTVSKDVIDIPYVPRAQKTRHQSSVGRCSNGHKIDTTPKGITRGSSFGPNIMTYVVCLFFQTLSLAQIADNLALMGIPNVSKSTVFGALKAVAAEKFASKAGYITKRLGKSAFLMADETPIRLGKKRGYVWIFIGTYGIKIVVSPSRAKIVLDMHCPYFHIPITVDGYPVYGSFETIQRCWAHILREVELLAVRHGDSMSDLHQRLQSMYHGAKSISPDISEDQLNSWIDNTVHIADIYTKLGYSYGEKLRNAAPNLYTFVRHKGMEPTNNKSEQKLRKIVMHKKIRQMFRSVTGMNTYGILMTCLMTWDDQGHDVSEKIYKTIMAS